MPIRINLLAEAQAAEEFRRRDPVKRALWVGALLIAAMLAWASILQGTLALRKSQVTNLEQEIKALDEEHGKVVESQTALNSARQKMEAIERLRSSRYLSGNLLDALQHVFVEDIRVVKIKTDFSYTQTAATPSKTNSFTVTQGKPASSKEQIKVRIEAMDASDNPGDKVNQYKEAIASLPHVAGMFDDMESEVRLTGLNPPQTDANGRQFVLFTLECPYPEKVR